MIQVACIVEGDGEVAAVPVLLRKVTQWKTPTAHLKIQTPIRVHKDRFLNKEDEFRRHLLLAAAKAGDGGLVVVLLDADDDCPASKGKEVLENARKIISHRRVAVVLANREYEAWLIAGAASLVGRRGFKCAPTDLLVEAEVPRNAKGWIAERLPSRSYHESTDQPALTAMLDLELVHARSRSFRKLCSEWALAVQAA